MRRPPGPAGLPLVGSLFDYLGHQLDFVEQVAARHGDVAFFRLGRWPVYLVSHPSDVRRVLVEDHDRFVKSRGVERMKVVLGGGLLTSEGHAHLRRRRQVQPAFHGERVRAHGRVMVRRTLETAEEWRPGARLDLADEMRGLTLGIAGECLFGADLEAEVEVVGRALDELVEQFPRLVLPFSELLLRLPLPANRRFRRHRDRLDEVVYGLIDEAGTRDEGPPTVLSFLLEGEGEEALSRKEVRDEVITLLLAGHETTANALAWTFYLLDRNPDAEAALHRELDRVLGDRPPEPDDLPRLETTRRIVSEAMRLFPPAWLIGRRAVERWEVGGYEVPEGSMVFLSQWVVHRDQRWWTDPERFDPGRWAPEGENRRPRFAYFPFGGGRRQCIGEGFARAEAVLVVAALARRWKLRLREGADVRPRASVTLRPAGGVPVVLERRGREPSDTGPAGASA